MAIKFFILSAPRTGSTLLVRTLNSIDGICCHGELFLPGQVRGLRDDFDPFAATPEQRKARAGKLLDARNADAANFLALALDRPEPAVGLKIIYEDFLQARWQAAFAGAIADTDTRFIHLQRHNALRRYVSEQVMHAGGAIHSDMGGGKDRKVRVEISPEAFSARCQQLEQEVRAVQSKIAARPVLDIYYEDLSDNLPSTIKNVCDFLQLPKIPRSIEPGLQKVGQDDLSESVLNYQEMLENPATRPFALMD